MSDNTSDTDPPHDEGAAIQAIKALGIGEVVPAAYEDLLQPAAREVGKGLVVVAKAVNAVLSPVEGAVWGYEKIRLWLSVKITQKFADTPPEEIESPPLSVAGPAIVNLQFASDTECLRDMYANLIASSMHRDTKSSAHPSFVRVIEQLSPDEARILRSIGHMDAGDELLSESYSESEGHGYRFEGSIAKAWLNVCEAAGVENIDQAPAYLDNLVRLRLLRESHRSETELHPAGHNDHGDWGPFVEVTNETSVSVTEYGRMLFDSCIDQVDATT